MEEPGTSEPREAPAPRSAHPREGPRARAPRFWWPVLVALAGAAVGALAGFAVSAGSEEQFEARVSVYLGRPTAPAGQNQLQGLQTHPATVRQIVRSQATAEAVASEFGIDARQLRQGISAAPVSRAFGRQLRQSELVEIRVRGPWQEETALAANRLAGVAVERVSGYVDTKIEGLETLRETQDAELASLARHIEELASADASLSPSLRAHYLDFARDRLVRRDEVQEARAETQAALTLAQEVERAQVIVQALAVTVMQPASRRVPAIGAVVGLIVAVAASALVGRAALRRRLRVPDEAGAP